jgi:CRP-like cAMP-binding protein
LNITSMIQAERPGLRRRLSCFFDGVPEHVTAVQLRFRPGEVVLRQEDPCTCVYALIEGRAVASGFQPGYPVHTYEEFRAVTLFGEYELLCGAGEILAEVRAKTACRFWVLSREDYFSWMFSSRDMTLLRVREVVRSLWAQARRERSYLRLDSDSRFLYFLINWYETNARSGSVRIPLTHAAISEETGVCPRTINRNIRTFREQGLFTVERGKIQITDTQYARLKAELERRLAGGRAAD